MIRVILTIAYILIGFCFGILYSHYSTYEPTTMNMAKCKSLNGYPYNDGWGNYTCYVEGEVIR